MLLGNIILKTTSVSSSKFLGKHYLTYLLQKFIYGQNEIFVMF